MHTFFRRLGAPFKRVLSHVLVRTFCGPSPILQLPFRELFLCASMLCGWNARFSLVSVFVVSGQWSTRKGRRDDVF